MKDKLSPDIIAQIRASTGRLIDVAARFNVSTATVTRYRPVRRRHLSGAEYEQIITEWVAHIPTRDTAKRLGVHIETIQKARRRALDDLHEKHSNG